MVVVVVYGVGAGADGVLLAERRIGYIISPLTLPNQSTHPFIPRPTPDLPDWQHVYSAVRQIHLPLLLCNRGACDDYVPANGTAQFR